MRVLIFASAMLVASPAAAESWKFLWQDDNSGRIYADVDSERADGNDRYVSGKQERPDHKVVVTSNRIDCSKRELSVLTAVAYDTDGTVLDREDFRTSTPPTVAIAPGSGFEALANEVCR
jgi:hypothetical protein